MRTGSKIRVLVVDDSLVFREVIAKGIGFDPAIEVVATACDPFEARDKILEFAPDVMTLDVEMPKMDGIEFLKRLLPQYPIPVVVVSAVNQSVFDAMKYGAIDFVTKPTVGSAEGIQGLISDLISKIKIAANAKVEKKIDFENVKMSYKGIHSAQNKLIAIGSSTGGTEAVLNVIKSFSEEMPCTLVVQHMPPIFTKLYADRLNSICKVEVREANNGDRIYKGLVLIAPGDYHMRIKRDPKGYFVECFQGEKVNGHCPSVDVLFHSVAKYCGSNAIGVILTGMGYDGAKGLLDMKKSGAITIGQNEETSVVYGMPKVAYDIGAVQKQVRLDEISDFIQMYLYNGDKNE